MEELNEKQKIHKFLDTPPCIRWGFIFLLYSKGWKYRLASKNRVCRGEKWTFTLENPRRHNLNQVVKVNIPSSELYMVR